MKKELYFTISLVLVFIVLLSSVKTTQDSYYKYYKKTEENILKSSLDNTYNYRPLRIFNTYTGFETGYGFFGTNVSSEFVISYDLFDNNQKQVDHQIFKLNSNEGSIRFMSLNRVFLDRLTKPEDELFVKYVKIIMQEISKFIYNKYDKKYSVNLKVYLYNFPSLEEYGKGKTNVELYLLDEMSYKR
ncbi:hypothetical protein [Chryseobacterium limigenitum]|uniref:Uncharacterized protein n=1 Tax=Chryseobacterium limigenitum TaxID=1612149 RepID=A0A1K2IMQ3_9FLAO|nr:hypothetical protein [Chryseobacterium limigenitum]SFZ93713.1 hypothetical protein SAMN05216324_105199 [Chryseobacterium limigenitum]